MIIINKITLLLSLITDYIHSIGKNKRAVYIHNTFFSSRCLLHREGRFGNVQYPSPRICGVGLRLMTHWRVSRRFLLSFSESAIQIVPMIASRCKLYNWVVTSGLVGMYKDIAHLTRMIQTLYQSRHVLNWIL